MAPKKQDWAHCADNWIAFSSIDNLKIDGTGGFDGQGGSWWGGSSSYETDMMMITRKKFGFISLLDNCDKPSVHIILSFIKIHKNRTKERKI